MTAQEMFDEVVKKVVAPGGPSMTRGSCCYRSEDGRKCAAGHLIPDDKYRPNIESMTVLTLRHTYPDVLPWAEEHDGLVQTLQQAHDRHSIDFDGGFVERFKESCREVARRFNLDPAAAA